MRCSGPGCGILLAYVFGMKAILFTILSPFTRARSAANAIEAHQV